MLADLLRDGLPERHVLIVAESAVATRHPLVEALAARGAVVDAGELTSQRGGAIAGLDSLVGELARETGTTMRRDAIQALADRTLRAASDRGGTGIDADSAARFGAEYRKLAALTGGAAVELSLVEGNVEDRGQEEVWSILDALGKGRPELAWARISRRLAGAEDALRERLSLLSLLSSHGRQMVAVSGAMVATGARANETSYGRFKERVAPALQGEIDGVEANPLAKLHPFRLHRTYLAAGGFPAAALARIPARLLEAELRLKGGSDDPDSALAALVMALASPRVKRGKDGTGGSRRRVAGGGRS